MFNNDSYIACVWLSDFLCPWYWSYNPSQLYSVVVYDWCNFMIVCDKYQQYNLRRTIIVFSKWTIGVCDNFQSVLSNGSYCNHSLGYFLICFISVGYFDIFYFESIFCYLWNYMNTRENFRSLMCDPCEIMSCGSGVFKWCRFWNWVDFCGIFMLYV